MKCENCEEEHKGEYGSGRFCGSKCARGFSTKAKRQEINEKVSKSLTGRECWTGLKGTRKKEKVYKTCPGCGELFSSPSKHCSTKCWQTVVANNKSEREIYKAKCRFSFNVYNYPKWFDVQIINKYGWYSPFNRENNLNGVSRDHRISISEGFEKGYDPAVIAHPANCELMRHSDNQKKRTRSSITYEELLQEIEKFNRVIG